MKRIILVFAIFFAASTMGFSQLSFGLKGGLNFSKLPENISVGNAGQIVTALDELNTGFHFGGLVFFGLWSGFAQIEILYSQTAQDMMIQMQSAEHFESKFKNIDIPLNLGLRFGPLKVGVGPIFSYLIKNDENLNLSINFGQKLKELTLGYQVGGGLKLGNLVLDLKYQGNLTGYGEQITLGSQTFELDRRPHNFLLSAGLLF